MKGRDVTADVTLRTVVHGARAADACAGCACGWVCMSAWWMRACTPARPPRLRHKQRRFTYTSRASMPLACPWMRSVVRGAMDHHFPNVARELKNIVIKGAPRCLPCTRHGNATHGGRWLRHSHPARGVAPLRPPASVLACMGRQLLLRWNLRESLVATACLAGHGGVTLRSASRMTACTYVPGACRLSCRAPSAPRGSNTLRRPGQW